MPDVTDIHFQGCREVFVELADGTIERHRSPFRSNREIEDFLARIARRAGDTERAGYTRRRAGEAGADG